MFISDNSRDDRFEIGEVGSESTYPGNKLATLAVMK
jgi:hypothetical protein